MSATTAGDDSAPAAHQARLEFLGDRVLGFVATEHVFDSFPALDTSRTLADARAFYVRNAALARVGRQLGVGDVLAHRLEDASLGEKRLADTVEALVGAVYTTLGAAEARDFVKARIMDRPLDTAALLATVRPKAALQRLRREQGAADEADLTYRVTDETGRKTHQPVFQVGVFAGDEQLAHGVGRSIRKAEDAAAQAALHAHYGVQVEPAEDGPEKLM